MGNQVVKQVKVVNQTATDSNRLSETIALFDADGAPIDLADLGGGGGEGGSSLTPGDLFSVDVVVVATTSKFGEFDMSDPTTDDGEWYDYEEDFILLPAGFYNVTMKPSGGITGALTDLWKASLVTTSNQPLVVAQADPYNDTYRIGTTQLIHLKEETPVSLQWSRVGTTSGQFTLTLDVQSYGYDLV